MRLRFLLLIVIVILLMLLLSGPVWPGASEAFADPVTLDCPAPGDADVTVRELVPGTCGCSTVMTSPLHVVKIPGPVTGGTFQHSTSPLCP